ncbi:MAG: threonine-phosphate decarboxylase [Rhodoblastus sp.]|nr:threonine-phosphate decarboxylase [Rhodoblastus sp.]
MLHARPAPEAHDAIAPLEHGGDLAAARRRFADAPEPWIDLSTGINPHAYPVCGLPAECFARLPEPAALLALEEIAARAYRVADARTIVAAPGAQALIQMLPRILPGPRVGILGPTYAEHAASWLRAGRAVVACADVTQLADCDVAVIVNPNNPTGRVVERDALLALARRTRLIVDESFADLAPAESIAGEAAACGAIVLRSFGKTYGLAGVRLGFAIAPHDIAARLHEAFGPWPVSGPAIALGARALGDRDWLEAARRRLADDAARLDALLCASGFEIAGGTPLFRLAAHDCAQAIADRLGRAGVHIRRFAEHPRWLRFGIPAAAAWARLEAALRGAP